MCFQTITATTIKHICATFIQYNNTNYAYPLSSVKVEIYMCYNKFHKKKLKFDNNCQEGAIEF